MPFRRSTMLLFKLFQVSLSSSSFESRSCTVFRVTATVSSSKGAGTFFEPARTRLGNMAEYTTGNALEYETQSGNSCCRTGNLRIDNVKVSTFDEVDRQKALRTQERAHVRQSQVLQYREIESTVPRRPK